MSVSDISSLFWSSSALAGSRGPLLARSCSAISPPGMMSCAQEALSKSQELFILHREWKEIEEAPFAELQLLLNRASDVIPPPPDVGLSLTLGECKTIMEEIGLVASASNHQLPKEKWPAAYPEASTHHAHLRNRYENVLPTALDLVALKEATNPDTHYINASRFEQMVLTQGPFISPFVDTVADFWVLAFENATDIVCLTDERGMGGEGRVVEKSYPYWQLNVPFHKEKIGLTVRLEGEPQVVIEASQNSEQVTKRIVEVTLGDKHKTLTHWHYEKWADQGVCDPQKLARLIALVLNNPSVVHCSAGIGRSGVFAIAKMFCGRFRRTKRYPTKEEIKQAVIDLRARRPTSVQGAKQFKLILDTIRAFAQL